MYSYLEQVLIKACTKKAYSREPIEITDLFQDDFNKSELDTQLQLFSVMNIKIAGKSLTFQDIHKHIQSAIPSCTHFAGVPCHNVCPSDASNNAVSKRSASAMHRTHFQLNNVMVLHIHRHLTDKVDNTAVLKEFASAIDDRRKHFGLFH